MAIQRWNPYYGFEDMDRRLDNMIRHPLMVWRRPPLARRAPILDTVWTPPTEVYEKGDRLVVRADIPGIKPEEIDISVDDDMLTIKGERKFESEVKDEDYYSCELSYGRFSRSIMLPSKVQSDKVKANYDDGILEITLPKASESKSKKVAVKSQKAKTSEAKSK